MTLRPLLSALATSACLTLAAQSLYPGVGSAVRTVPDAVTVEAEAFELADVRLLPGRLHDNLMRDSAWMASIDTRRLLHSFRNNAGVFAGLEGGYESVPKLGGWESLDCDLRGHTSGHLLSAYALMYSATGDELFKLKGDSLVDGLAEVQQALGGGYLSAFPEELINRNIRGKSVWAPWYTLHKILSGLIDQYTLTGNSRALDVARRMADWAYGKVSGLSEETRRLMLRNEFGGVNEAFYNLYSLTGDDRHLALARFFYHNDAIDPLKASSTDFGTKHTNTFIPKVIAEARNYEINGDAASRALAEHFWGEMTGHHCFATGSLSQKEHYFDTSDMARFINGYTGETCCTYNMLKLARHIFCWGADPAVADWYERALFNHILAQQDTESGMVCYFLPLLSGAYKVYSTPEQSFWCCVGSGFESHAKYAEGIYYRSGDRLFVNLLAPSALDWKEQGVKLTQRTSFPADGHTSITIDEAPGSSFKISLRYPAWSGKPVVKVNGKRVKVRTSPSSYIDIERTWTAGDRIEAEFPMTLALEGVTGDSSRAAVLYGPIVLAGDLGTEGMAGCAPFSDPTVRNDYYTYDYKIPEGLKTNLTLDRTDIGKSLKRVDGKLEFVSDEGDVLRPLFDTHRRRYVVYWKINDAK
ncbi:MAG: glycoside hydrolase family 127 protein [Muribaculaceae bacterium]|nr:glycoside hydrolase family 127 protein [Muribaculaceae bacterium]